MSQTEERDVIPPEMKEEPLVPPTAEPVKEKIRFKGKDKQKNEELEQLRADLQESTEKHLRLAAEYDNFRKRSLKERETIYPEAKVLAVAALLPVADNLERALSAPCTDAEYKKGTEMTFKSLNDAFEQLGVESFGTVGDLFDPNLHNAVMHVEEDGFAPESIAEVFQRGYKLGDRVIRVAMVKVAN